jgi:hypothetical protein
VAAADREVAVEAARAQEAAVEVVLEAVASDLMHIGCVVGKGFAINTKMLID